MRAREEAIKRLSNKVSLMIPEELVSPDIVAAFRSLGKRLRKNKELGEDVLELDPKNFKKTFKVGDPYKGDGISNWEDLYDSERYWEGPLISRPGDIDSADIIGMENSIKNLGIRVPVRVSRITGELLDGHHRVMLADQTGQKIPFRLV